MFNDEVSHSGYRFPSEGCIRSTRERLTISHHHLDRTRLLVRFSSEKLRTSRERIEASDRLVEGLRCLLCEYGDEPTSSLPTRV